MNISKKLFLSFLGLTSVVLIATLSLARWGFSQGFSDFINALEEQRLEKVIEELTPLYQQFGEDWQKVPEPLLNRLIQRHELGPSQPPPRKGPRGERPPRPGPMDGSRPKGPTSIISTVLFDMNEEPISETLASIDNGSEAFTLTEIAIDYKGTQVGTLRSYHSNPLGSEIASDFSRQQLLWSAGIGALCLLLAALSALLISNILLNPIKTVLQSVSRLRAGKFDLILEHSRKDELGQLMSDVEALSQTLEGTRVAKSKWIADISHELRTPLTVLSGEIDLIKIGAREFNEANLLSLEEEVRHLTHLVEDLYQLSLSDIGALRYELKETKILPLIESAINKIHSEFDKKDVAIRLVVDRKTDAESSPIMLADEHRIEQLMMNLLNNSLQYTDAPGELIVTVLRCDGKLELRFADSAPSATEEECQRFFDPLYRQDLARTRHQSGAGLGLAICRNIVEAHTGEIFAAPNSFGGITITVRFICCNN